MPARIMMAAAHNIISVTERMLLSKDKLRELDRRRVDRMIRELNDEIYNRLDAPSGYSPGEPGRRTK